MSLLQVGVAGWQLGMGHGAGGSQVGGGPCIHSCIHSCMKCFAADTCEIPMFFFRRITLPSCWPAKIFFTNQ
jgi:hypothetical protein